MSREEAKLKGEKFLELTKFQIKGKWQLDIFENMGWHYVVYLGTIAISEYLSVNHKENSYSCMISDQLPCGKDYRPSGTPSHWYVKGNFNSPKKALDASMKKNKQVIKYQNKVLEINLKLLS